MFMQIYLDVGIELVRREISWNLLSLIMCRDSLWALPCYPTLSCAFHNVEPQFSSQVACWTGSGQFTHYIFVFRRLGFSLMSLSKLLSLSTDSVLINFHSIHVLIQKFIDNSSMKLIYVIWKITSLWALKTRSLLACLTFYWKKNSSPKANPRQTSRDFHPASRWRFIKAENIDDSKALKENSDVSLGAAYWEGKSLRQTEEVQGDLSREKIRKVS